MDLAGLELQQAEAFLPDVKAPSADHPFAHYIFDSYKPAHARASPTRILQKVGPLQDALSKCDWRTASDLEAVGNDLKQLDEALEKLYENGAAIFDGCQPARLCNEALTINLSLPSSWEDQRRLLGRVR